MVPPPDKVISPFPSMIVSFAKVTFLTLVTVRVTGEVPQLKVITPPAAIAVVNAASVQLAGVPVPTTVVGELTLARVTGVLHTVGGTFEKLTLSCAVGVEGLKPVALEIFHTKPPLVEVKVAPLRDTGAPVVALVSCKRWEFSVVTGWRKVTIKEVAPRVGLYVGLEKVTAGVVRVAASVVSTYTTRHNKNNK